MRRIAASQRLTALLLAVADGVVLLAAGLLASWLRFGSAYLPSHLREFLAHPGFMVYALAAQWALATTFDLYRPQNWRVREQLLVRLAALATGLPIALALGTYFVPAWRFGRGLLALTLAIAILGQWAARSLFLRLAARPAARAAVLFGDGPIVGALVEELERRPSPPFRIVRHLPAPTAASPAFDPDALAEVDLVIVASLSHEETVDRLAALNFRGTPVVDAAGAFAALTGRIPVLQVDSRWFIATGDFSSLAESPFHHIQRFLDAVAASTLLLLTAPFLLLGALAVLLSSGPPVMYRQVRLGRFRRPFILLKLRTMRNGAEASGPVFAEEHDRRVNFVGRFLRRWRVDELPQLVNVLRGEMSLVGPRPERPEVAEKLEREIPFFAFRYSVRPGLTGWAQVHLPYCAETEDHLVKLEYDLYSVRHHGPAMYLLVLLRTLGALVFRPGR
jgi:lipopolysaccharide/colanic/teichoic acid biosynthesis glycosyltransferase